MSSKTVVAALSAAVTVGGIAGLLLRSGAVSPDEAVRREPGNPFRWCDLADFFVERGRLGGAEDSFRRACELGPRIPPVLIRAANFHFAHGKPEDALPYTTRVLGITPAYDQVIFSTYRRMEIPVETIALSGIPDDPRARRSYFENLVSWASPDQAEIGWRMLIDRGETNDRLASSYVSLLLRHGKPEAATQIWADHLGERRGDYTENNRIFNGGFEHDFTGCALDWQIKSAGGVSVQRDSEVVTSGQYSLRITFHGEENLGYSGVSQVVALLPGTYRMRAAGRAQSLTTDQGVHLSVFGANGMIARTGELTGDTGWNTLETDFTIGEGESGFEVRLCRDPSMKIDSRIRGTIWVDDISIVRRR